jgi:hypothetical protein
MGIDAFIFAHKARKCFYFDRVKNIARGAVDMADEEPYDRLRDPTRRVPLDLLKEIAQASIQYWKTATDEGLIDDNTHRVRWCELIIKFAEQYPDDTFFVVTDHDSPDCHEIRRGEGYDEVTFP